MAVTTASTVRLAELTTGERRFVFARPLLIEVGCPDGVWDVREAETGFDSHGVTSDEAWENFGLLFANAWDTYVNNGEESPFARVRQLKAKLQNIILEVVPA